jgi:hypothetical protein
MCSGNQQTAEPLPEQTMRERLASEGESLHRLCDEALYYVWDPIGVSTFPEA